MLLVLTALGLVATPLSAASIAVPATHAAGDLLTLTVRDPDPAWLTFDVTRTPRLIITGPDGGSWTRAAYLAQDHRVVPDHAIGTPEFAATGPHELRVRHSLRSSGTHAFVLRTPDGVDVQRGSFAVAPPPPGVKSGPLRIAAANPRLLATPDGTPFIAIGPNIAWAMGPDRVRAFARLFSGLAAAGGTHARVWMASWCGQIEGDSPDAYRLDHGWLLDAVFAHARERGLRLTVVLDNHHDLDRGLAVPYGERTGDALRDRVARRTAFFATPLSEQYVRRLRYVLARWGADDTVAAWELGNELDLAEPHRDRVLAWAGAAAAQLRQLDADARLIAASFASTDDWDRLAAVPGIDLAQVHAYVLEWSDPTRALRLTTRDGIGMLERHAVRGHAVGKPLCFAEVGFQGTNERNPGNDLDQHGLLLFQQAWAGLMLGGYSSGMAWWWDRHIEANTLWPIYRGMARICADVDWRDPRLVPLTPNPDGVLRVLGWVSPKQALLWPHLRSDTWHAHLVEQVPRPALGQTVSLRLAGFSPGRYRIRTMSMREGSETNRTTTSADSTGHIDVQLPTLQRDYVLVVQGE